MAGSSSQAMRLGLWFRYWAGFRLAPYHGTPHHVARRMLQLAGVNSNDKVVDLGCGDARLLILAAKYHGAHGYGVELDSKLFEEGSKAVEVEGLTHMVTLEQKDAFLVDLSTATVVTLYLTVKGNNSGYCRLERSDRNLEDHSYQRSHQSKGDKKRPFCTERKPRAPEFYHNRASNMNSTGTTSEALAALKNRLQQALLNVYIKCGELSEARRVFDELEKKDVVTWNTMIAGYAKSKHGFGHEAFRLFLLMRREGFEPDAITYTSILNASASAGALEWVKEVHGHAIKVGLESDVRVGNALVHMYAKSGSIDGARLVFDRMETRDKYTWTIMIGGLAEHGCGHEAYKLFLKMRQEGFEPDAVTFMSILNASASAGAMEWVKEIHGHATEAGLESDVRVGSALVHVYAESGSLDNARLVFDRMEKRAVATWNGMIGGLAKHGFGH